MQPVKSEGRRYYEARFQRTWIAHLQAVPCSCKLMKCLDWLIDWLIDCMRIDWLIDWLVAVVQQF